LTNGASARLKHEIQAQLAQHGKYLVQPQGRFALLERMDKARGNASKGSEFVLVKP